MGQPRPFDRITSYTDYSAANPSRQQPGAQLDAEFDAIKATTDDIRTNLALLQRDDGKIASKTVTMDALAPDAIAFLGSMGSADTIAAIEDLSAGVSDARDAAVAAQAAAEAVRVSFSVSTLSGLKAAALDLGVINWAGRQYTYETDNAPYTGDDFNFVESDNSDLTLGAWVLQDAGSLRASDGNTVQDNLDRHQGKLDEIVCVTDPAFGAVGDGATDNSAAFALVATYAATKLGGCTITVPAGVYYYDTSPNWAIPGLELRCEEGVTFFHTGTGVAFNVDGGATGDGVYRFRLTGKPIIKGNAETTICLYIRAIHTSYFSATLRDATTAGLKTQWCVCCTFDIECSGLTFGGLNPAPVNCVVLDERGSGVGETTSACVFTNMRLGNATDAALLLISAIECTFVGGAAEVSGGGVSIGANSPQNTFINFDMEVNTSYDLTCAGDGNNFINLYSSNLTIISGNLNSFTSGRCNAIQVNNTANGTSFRGVYYAANGGTFTDNGTRTSKTSIRNLTSSLFDNDIFTFPSDVWMLDSTGGERLYFASANTNYYKAVSNHIFRDSADTELAEVKITGIDLPAGKVLTVAGAQVVGPRGASLPADATDLASAIALVNAIKARIKTTGGHGLVAD